MSRLTMFAAAMCAAMACCVPAAQAATVTGTRVFSEEGVQGLPDSYVLLVRYEGGPGEANDVTVTTTGEQVTFEDAGAEVEAHDKCTSDGPSRVVCSSSGDELSFIMVVLGDGDDSARIDDDRDRLIRVWGDSGDDTLHGGISDERLYGGLGGDLVDGGEGIDTINGGGGRDELRAGEQANPFEHDLISDGDRDESADADTIVGHGETQLSYRLRRKPVTVDLAAGTAGTTGERDTLIGIRRIVGGRGADVLLGSGDGDYIAGHAGADRIDGRGGGDSLSGDAGPDRVFGRRGDDAVLPGSDDARDITSCGPGYDVVHLSDKRDLLRPACEDGAWATARDAASDEVNWITAHPTLGRRRATFRSTCREHPRCRGRILLKASGTRKLLGRGRFRFRRNQFRNPRTAPRHDVVARLNKRGRKRVRRGGDVRVTIVSRRDCNGCTNQPPPVKTGFTIDMRR